MVRSAPGRKRAQRFFGSCLVVGSALLVACGDDDEKQAEVVVYCEGTSDTGTLIVCIEMTVEKDDVDWAVEGCEMGDGMQVDSCPTENMVGDCVQTEDRLVSHYYAPTYDPELGARVCDALGGVWTPR
jgi:hypothetical protein